MQSYEYVARKLETCIEISKCVFMVLKQPRSTCHMPHITLHSFVCGFCTSKCHTLLVAIFKHFFEGCNQLASICVARSTEKIQQNFFHSFHFPTEMQLMGVMRLDSQLEAASFFEHFVVIFCLRFACHMIVINSGAFGLCLVAQTWHVACGTRSCESI